MAERKVDIVISAHDAFTSTLSKAQASFQSFADGIKGKAEQLVNLKTVAIAAGAANDGLVEFLSTLLGIKKSAIKIDVGEKSRDKTVVIEGLTKAEAEKALATEK